MTLIIVKLKEHIMSDDVYMNDNELMRKCIYRDIVLPIAKDDCKVDKKIKGLINTLVLNNVTTNHSWNGKTYYRYSSLWDTGKALLKCNQIRFKNWYFKPVKINDKIKLKLK